jgi:molybdate transport system permease protein
MRYCLVLMLLAFMAAGLAGCRPGPPHDLAGGPAGSTATLTVFAATSLADALSDMTGAFERARGCEVRISFAPSSTLARQIAAGAEGDVFFSAHPKWMDYIEERDLLAGGSRRDLLANRLVCVGKRGSTRPGLSVAEWLAATEGRIAMGDPGHVPAGMYGAQALRALGLWEEVAGRLAPCADTRSALRAVELGECGGGIVYATDAAASDTSTVLAEIDESLHEPVRYSAAMLRGAGPLAGPFMEFLTSRLARDAFERQGFICLDNAAPAARNVGESGAMLSDAEIRAAAVSVKVAGMSVLLLLAPGIAAGWLLARCRFPGKGVFEALTHLPMVVPPVVSGYLLLLVLGRQGLVGQVLDRHFGIQLGFTYWAAVIAAAVMAFPLMVRAVRLAIELVDSDLEEAAMMSGAGPGWRFVSVTLPLAGPGVLAGAVLAFSRGLGEFGATMIFAGNIPGRTQTMPLAIYTAMQRPDAESGVLRLAVLSILVAMGALWASRRLESRMHKGRGGA